MVKSLSFPYAGTRTTLFSYISNSLRLGELYGAERDRREERYGKQNKYRFFVLITQNVPTNKGKNQSRKPHVLHSRVDSRCTFYWLRLWINPRNIYWASTTCRLLSLTLAMQMSKSWFLTSNAHCLTGKIDLQSDKCIKSRI